MKAGRLSNVINSLKKNKQKAERNKTEDVWEALALEMKAAKPQWLSKEHAESCLLKSILNL